MDTNKTGRPAVRNAVWGVALVAGFAICKRTARRIGQSAQLVRESAPLNAAPDSPAASLLIVGDSTAVGTGASSPQASLAGRIADAYPNLRILNLAKGGAKFHAIADQLNASERFDVILILGGANDVMRLTATARLKKNIDLAIDRALRRAHHVIVMPAPNVGNAPVFGPPISWFLTHRARALHAACRASVRTRGVTYVNLYRDKANDPFSQEPDRLIASDDLHPNDEGYEVWFAELERQALISQLFSNTANAESSKPF